ncbi:MAG TPA: hypothetical protein ENH96_01060 [Chlamydiae bacterium]|nr:hypothetical protein [Chlamydiota bacterium]
MKNVKFYPIGIAIVACIFLAIPVATIVAKVADIHIPSGEEINMMEPEKSELESEWAHIHASHQEVEVPDSNLPELTQEQIEFDNQRTYDGCNGIPEKD